MPEKTPVKMSDRHRTRQNRLGTIFPIALYLIIGVVLMITPNAARSAAGISDLQFEKLAQGEILVDLRQTGDPPRGMVEATILIEASAENIWQIMTDCLEIPKFVPGLKACRVLDSGRNWEIIQHEVKWIWFLPSFIYVFRADYEPNRKIDFVRVGGDLREMKGSWRLTPLNRNRQTVVRYSVYLDPGFFVPQWLVRQSLKADLPAVLLSLREKVISSRP